MIPIDEPKEKKKNYFLGFIFTFFVGLIIFALVAVFYFVISDTVPQEIKDYFFPKVMQVDKDLKPDIKKDPPKVANPNSFSTKVVRFIFPAVLPTEIKKGSCSVSSVAQPYRDDAWECSVGDLIYDPCFSNKEKNSVVCQMNPLIPDIFLINFTKILPSVDPVNFKNNWAWFLELEDGTICSPYTVNKPTINNELAFYGCKPEIKGDLDVLIGDLNSGETWTAKRVIVTKNKEGKKETKFSEVVNIKSVWQ